MNRLNAMLVLVAALGGCATTAGYQKLLSGWVGSDEVSLVRKWGPPLRSHTVADRRFLVFESRSELVLPEVPPSYQTSVKGNKAYTTFVAGSPASVVSYVCMTTFEMKAGRVVGSTFSGNDCRAKV